MLLSDALRSLVTLSGGSSLGRGAAVSLVLALAACSGSSSTDPSATPRDTGPGGGASEAGATANDGGAPSSDAAASIDALSPAPPVSPFAAQMPFIKDHGGGVIAAPKTVIISFPGDPLAPAYQAFATMLAASPTWKQTVSEYGVGPLTVVPPVQLHRSSPTSLTDAEVQSVIETALGNPANTFPAPDSSTVYTLLIPYGVTETGPQGGTSCGFGGYHRSFTLASGTRIAYAVIAECAQNKATTRTLAHELAEAVTDPFAPDSAAYAGVTPRDLGFVVGTTLGSEVGDMCETWTPFLMPTGEKSARVWSNASAAAGENPCLPIPPEESWFMTLPATAVPDMVGATAPKSGNPISGNGYKVAQGSSRVIDLGLLGDATTAPWTIDVHEVTPANVVTFALDKSTGKAGDHVMLTVTAVGDTSVGVPFAVDSTIGAIKHTWLGVIGSP